MTSLTPEEIEQGQVDYVAAKLCGEIETYIHQFPFTAQVRITRMPWAEKYGHYYNTTGRPICICRVYLPNGMLLNADTSADTYPFAFAWALVQAKSRLQDYLKQTITLQRRHT